MADALVVTGPTASGKTALAVELAEHLSGEIVSMDSRQVYRGMDIGTAKATPAQRSRVPHHLVDVVDPDQRYSAGDFARDVRRLQPQIRARGALPILAGGTGFFLRALTHPLFHAPQLESQRRADLAAYLADVPAAELQRWLRELDPRLHADFAGRSGGGGRQRLVRALEIPLLTGRPLSWWHEHAEPSEAPLDVQVFVLSLPREELVRRIDSRVEVMVREGLAAEVDRLMRNGYDTAAPGMNATGYPEMLAYLRGELTLDDAVEQIRRATRRYARRQLTWFRNQLPPGAIWLDGTLPRQQLLEEVTARWRQTTAS